MSIREMNLVGNVWKVRKVRKGKIAFIAVSDVLDFQQLLRVLIEKRG